MESIFARLNYYLSLARSLKGIHKRQHNAISNASSFYLVNGKLLVALKYYNNCYTPWICHMPFVANSVWRNVKNVLVMLYVGKYNRAITQPEWRTNCYSRKIFEGTCVCLITSILFPMWLIHLFIPTNYPSVMSQKVKIEKTMWYGDMMAYSIIHMMMTDMQLWQLLCYLNEALK